MDLNERMRLENYYHELADAELQELVMAGRESFQEGVYDLILTEARRRNIDDAAIERLKAVKRFREMADDEIVALLAAPVEMSPAARELLATEAVERGLEDRVRSGFPMRGRSVRHEGGEEAAAADALPSLLPLMVCDGLESAQPYLEALTKAGIRYNLQIMVDENDYPQAAAATDTVPPAEPR